jgi:phosphoenolpyruvate carboxylase
MKQEIIDTFAKKSGISKNLASKIKSLSRFLEQIITEREGAEVMDQLAELPQLAANAFDEENQKAFAQIQEKIGDYSTELIAELLRLYTVYFNLMNSLEQHEITRINRDRAFEMTPNNPRSESIAEAIYTLKNDGYSYEDALGIIGKLDIQPTTTAHPTEAQRRSVLRKQQQITSLISRLSQEEFTPEERENVETEILNEINLLLATDEVRTEKVMVEDEVKNGLYYLTHAIWQTIPQLYKDLRHAFEMYYDEQPELPAILRYRSWIGSDRDGNPNVTEDVTWDTIMMQRQSVLNLYLDELDDLRRHLSVSENKYAISQELKKSIEKDEQENLLSDRYRRLYSHEPYRRKIMHMAQKIQEQLNLIDNADKATVIKRSADYTARDFQNDIQLLIDSLTQNGLEGVARLGKLDDLMIRAKTFGFHLATLDIRQHSRLHEETIAELMKLAQVNDHYGDLPEEEKVELLTKELSNPRPLSPARASLSDQSQEIMGVFELISDMQQLDENSFDIYIISMTHGVSDMLEVLILAKEAGLWGMENSKVKSTLDVVPLFETIDDLEACDKFMAQIYENDLYSQQIKARGNFQEIMLGYSDSGKDGGYWMANWALEKAQEKLGAVCRDYDIDFRLFHGRGGTVGRGGGRSNQAIRALPPISNNGRIRFTEQGEIISFRYSLPEITHRHLEQIVNAMINVTASSEGERTTYQPFNRLMEEISGESMQAYRGLIDHEDFWPWYTTITPIEHISRLPIASRPVSRGKVGEVDFESLRAIPWNFSWMQVRYIAPGWYGSGAAFQKLFEEEDEAIENLQDEYQNQIFFRTILDNAQREMARAHLRTAKAYNISDDDPFDEMLNEDYDKAREAILKITGEPKLLANNEVIRNSIKFRNPFTYPLNLMQVELLKRWRDDKDNQELRNALFLSINGVAAAMQSTG